MSSILKDSYDEHFALIIGINEYENLEKLEYAVNDAKDIKDLLVNKFNYKEENIKLLIDKEATYQNIMENFYSLVNETARNDSVIIFFAGHGSNRLGLDREKGFLVPCDGTEEKMNTLINWDILTNESELIRAKHIFFIMDACYSGLALTRGGGSKRFLKDMIRRPVRQVLTAGKSNQKVKDSGGPNNNSIFTGYLIEALNGAAKTEQGVLCATSVMNYVYNKVSTNTKSQQTPGMGTIAGEGDFIFNYEEIFEKDGDKSKDNDILIEKVDLEKEYNVFEEDDIIKEVKELLSDSKNFIKVTEIVNNQLKIYLTKNSLYKDKFKVDTDDEFVNTIELYRSDVNVLLKILILLSYYGGELYLNLILKIIARTVPRDKNINLLYYPVYLMYYVTIISALESRNYIVLKNVIELEKKKTVGDGSLYSDNNLLIKTCNKMNEIEANFEFKVFSPCKNYKYPLSEYLYKEIQPLLDDFLFLGDDYPEVFLSTEILISVFYALYEYDEKKEQVWAPLGRYSYQMIYGTRDLRKFSINEVIEKINFYSGINKEEFINKYNKFLSKYFF